MTLLLGVGSRLVLLRGGEVLEVPVACVRRALGRHASANVGSRGTTLG